ncbi:uncharacterized, partial [Tachysurus ichikawai]
RPGWENVLLPCKPSPYFSQTLCDLSRDPSAHKKESAERLQGGEESLRLGGTFPS